MRNENERFWGLVRSFAANCCHVACLLCQNVKLSAAFNLKLNMQLGVVPTQVIHMLTARRQLGSLRGLTIATISPARDALQRSSAM